MLFRKKHPRSCSYCCYSTELSEDNLLCAKKGIIDAQNPCKKFRYDPIRRIPSKFRSPDFSKYDEEDFSL